MPNALLRRLLTALPSLPLALLCLTLAAPSLAQDQNGDAAEEQPAAGAPKPDEALESWRLLDGPSAVGVMRLIRSPGARALGFFVVQLTDHGVYEGVYNLKEDGQSVVGMFWPEGKLNEGSVSGFLDLDPEGHGRISFTGGGPDQEVTAR